MTMVERKGSDDGWRVERKKKRTVIIQIGMKEIVVTVVAEVEVIVVAIVDITTAIGITINCSIPLFVWSLDCNENCSCRYSLQLSLY